jgi:hypothetical protein
MSHDEKRPAQKEKPRDAEIDADQLDDVAGGLSPQPLPPARPDPNPGPSQE